MSTGFQSDDPGLSAWVDSVASIKAWTGALWKRESLACVRVHHVDDESGVSVATLVDPCFPATLGGYNNERVLLDLKIRVKLSGYGIHFLIPGEVYVIIGASAPIKYSSDHFGLHIPRPSKRTGLAKVLGAAVPWSQANSGGGPVLCATSRVLIVPLPSTLMRMLLSGLLGTTAARWSMLAAWITLRLSVRTRFLFSISMLAIGAGSVSCST